MTLALSKLALNFLKSLLGLVPSLRNNATHARPVCTSYENSTRTTTAQLLTSSAGRVSRLSKRKLRTNQERAHDT